MPKQKPSAKVASRGVTRAKLYVEEELDWLFREQPTEDFGIDAHVEVVDGEDVRGRLIALQIKSGKSWFGEPTTGGWWFRPDDDHVRYWKRHSLPVAVVLYNPATKLCHWQLVTDVTLARSKTGGWKLLVPETQMLNADAAKAWRAAAEGDPYELRLRELRLARPWMELLAQGKRLVVDFEEWINKSSGRGSISIGIDNEDGSDPEELVTWHLFVGPTNYAEAVPKMFAWADADVHEETYDDAEHDMYEAECSIWDEGDQFFTQSFSDWRRVHSARGIRPYNNAAGEVDYYRLELTLNELGKAFLIVDEFAGSDLRQLTL
ncbi:hypothetical protein DKT69_23865 [Micromonospora sicca]|uniref:DUF4365 domain-containing protein n=1 Tax=Micromonospora sicca TaxID=2202420 RepID=A0A317DC76_9ACTN|nr:DUF4365 domain-containing protein [Micromonospora sp. 4G51]PWR12481.1 hypothetical protein DKT69_23865 [Micromonospora sp. 4G51]